MEKANFDDIVRNLLVFLKGQVPSLQGKHSREDLAHQIQSIVYTLRTSIIQLEGASTSDPRNTPEYLAAIQELEGFKKTNARLEESLFLEMDKSQKLAGEIEKQSSLVKQRDLHIAELDEALRTAHAQSAVVQNNFTALSKEEKTALQKAAEEAVQDAQAAQAEISRLSIDLAQLRLNLDNANRQLEEVRAKSAAHEVDGTKHREFVEKALEAANQLFKRDKQKLQEELSSLQTERSSLQAELDRLKSQSGSSQEIDRALIRTFQEKIEKLQKAVQSAPAGDAVQNIQASTEAKIRVLEKALADARRQIEAGSASPADQLEAFTREKRELQQRVIDLEAIVRRVMSARGKNLVEPGSSGANTLRTEEIILFFEVLTTVVARLARSPENRDLRQKAEEAIQLLEKSHAVDPITSLGGIYEEKHHKVVRSYFAPFLEDGTIVNEISRGYRSGDYVIQRAVVWIAKSKFQCTECGSASRPQDNFCPKCGIELCAPDGTTKRRLSMLPTEPEVGIPLLDVLITRRQTQAAQALLSHLSAATPDHPGLLNRRQLITQLADESQI